jgi:hypothetical protein
VAGRTRLVPKKSYLFCYFSCPFFFCLSLLIVVPIHDHQQINFLEIVVALLDVDERIVIVGVAVFVGVLYLGVLKIAC